MSLPESAGRRRNGCLKASSSSSAWHWALRSRSMGSIVPTASLPRECSRICRARWRTISRFSSRWCPSTTGGWRRWTKADTSNSTSVRARPVLRDPPGPAGEGGVAVSVFAAQRVGRRVVWRRAAAHRLRRGRSALRDLPGAGNRDRQRRPAGQGRVVVDGHVRPCQPRGVRSLAVVDDCSISNRPRRRCSISTASTCRRFVPQQAADASRGLPTMTNEPRALQTSSKRFRFST